MFLLLLHCCGRKALLPSQETKGANIEPAQVCANCGEHNYSRRDTCYKRGCFAARPGADPQLGGALPPGAPGWNPGGWNPARGTGGWDVRGVP